MLRLDDALIRVSELAQLEAQKRNLDECDTEDLLCESKRIVEDLFSSISQEKIEDGSIKSVDPVEDWRHRGVNDMESDWISLQKVLNSKK